MDKERHELPVLIAQSGPLEGQRWWINKIITLGRDPNCDIVIPDRQVSRIHAQISPSPEGLILEDLGSKNGTYTRGEMLSHPIRLEDGDVIQIALVQQFLFLSSDATMPLEGSMVPHERTGKLFLDPRSRRVWIGNREVLPPLSVPQFRLLQALFNQQGEVVSRQELVIAIWKEDEAIGVSEQALDALIRRLRERIADIDPEHNYIVTVRGYGLRLDNPKE